MLTKKIGISVIASCLMLAYLSTAGHSQESSSEGSRSEEPWETMIFSLRNQPVKFVAETLTQAMQDHTDVTIAQNLTSNVLILRGSKETLESCAKILEALDRPPQTIHFDVAISVLRAGGAHGEKNEPISTDRLQLATLNENPATLKFEQQVSKVSGAVHTAAGEAAKVSQRQQIGTQLMVTPRIAGDEIAIELQIEKSWIDPADSTTDEVPSTTNRTSVRTTLSLKPGVAHTFQAKVSERTKEAIEVSISITASFDKSKEK